MNKEDGEEQFRRKGEESGKYDQRRKHGKKKRIPRRRKMANIVLHICVLLVQGL